MKRGTVILFGALPLLAIACGAQREQARVRAPPWRASERSDGSAPIPVATSFRAPVLALGAQWSCVLQQSRVRCWGATGGPRSGQPWFAAQRVLAIASADDQLCVWSEDGCVRCGAPASAGSVASVCGVTRLELDPRTDNLASVTTSSGPSSPGGGAVLDYHAELARFEPIHGDRRQRSAEDLIAVAGAHCLLVAPPRCENVMDGVASWESAGLYGTFLAPRVELETLVSTLVRGLERPYEQFRGSRTIACANSGGDLNCARVNARGQFETLPPLDGVAQYRVAARHVCVLRDDDSVWCAGDPSFGRVDGESCTERRRRSQFVASGARVLSSSARSLCAIVRSSQQDELYCAGEPGLVDRASAEATTFAGRTLVASAQSMSHLSVHREGVQWREGRYLVAHRSGGIVRRRDDTASALLVDSIRCGEPGFSDFCVGGGEVLRRSENSFVSALRWPHRAVLSDQQVVCVHGASNERAVCIDLLDERRARIRELSGVSALSMGGLAICAQRREGSQRWVDCWSQSELFSSLAPRRRRVPDSFVLLSSFEDRVCGADTGRRVICSDSADSMLPIDGAVVAEARQGAVVVQRDFVCWIDSVGAVYCDGAGPYCETSSGVSAGYRRVLFGSSAVRP